MEHKHDRDKKLSAEELKAAREIKGYNTNLIWISIILLLGSFSLFFDKPEIGVIVLLLAIFAIVSVIRLNKESSIPAFIFMITLGSLSLYYFSVLAEGYSFFILFDAIFLAIFAYLSFNAYIAHSEVNVKKIDFSQITKKDYSKGINLLIKIGIWTFVVLIVGMVIYIISLSF
jgi:signal transduction histidine kinase